MAFANPNITAYAVEATEFPDLAQKYRVSGVPKTVVNDEIEILGGLPQDAFVQQALRELGGTPPGEASDAGTTN
jgi:predicted DsbA family dithiol-disulfide isomerase